MADTETKIRLLSRGDGIRALPVVDVFVLKGLVPDNEGRYDTDPGPEREQAARSVVALIDTGAESDHIDQSLALRLRLAATGNSYGLSGVNGESQSPSYHADLLFPEETRVYRSELSAVNFSGKPWSIILGMQFIEQTRLILDVSRGEFRLFHR